MKHVHILVCETNHNQFKKLVIIKKLKLHRIHSLIMIQLTYKLVTERKQENLQILENNTLLINPWVKKEVSRKMKNILN